MSKMQNKYFIISHICIVLIFICLNTFAQQADSIKIKSEKKRSFDDKAVLDSVKNSKEKAGYLDSINNYLNFIEDFPSSPEVPDAYYKIGEIYNNILKEYSNAIEYYKTAFEKSPDSKNGKYSLFLIAFVFDEELKNKDSAIIYYEMFLKKYPVDTDPKQKLSRSAEVLLNSLNNNISIEEVIIKNNIKKENLSKDSIEQALEEDVNPIRYIVIADTGKNYYALREKMFLLSKKSGLEIDTMNRLFNKKKNLIAFPDDYKDDPDYAGLYFPRRYEGEYLSLEYYNYYTREGFSFDGKKGIMTMAIVSGVFADKEDAKINLDIIKKDFNKAFILTGHVYRGCMH